MFSIETGDKSRHLYDLMHLLLRHDLVKAVQPEVSDPIAAAATSRLLAGKRPDEGEGVQVH